MAKLYEIFKKLNFCLSIYIYIMDRSSQFMMFFLVFISLSMYLLCCTKKTNIFYAQIISGCGMFVTSDIGRKFLGLNKE